MAASNRSQGSSVKYKQAQIYSAEMQLYAALAVKHLSTLIALFEYHANAQRAGNKPSKKESQALAKTTLKLYKSLDRYMAILHPSRIQESTEQTDISKYQSALNPQSSEPKEQGPLFVEAVIPYEPAVKQEIQAENVKAIDSLEIQNVILDQEGGIIPPIQLPQVATWDDDSDFEQYEPDAWWRKTS
jgi:hypothetical protein